MGVVTEGVDASGVPMYIIREAKKDRLIGPRVFVSSDRREPLCFRGKVVGFVTPHETPSGMRLGPIFILPKYRNKGLLRKYYDKHPRIRYVAFIPNDRPESGAAHKAAGFVHWKRAAAGEWLKREAKP